MPQYDVKLTRIGYGATTFKITAKTLDEAKSLALEEAGEHDYNEYNSDYEVASVTEAEANLLPKSLPSAFDLMDTYGQTGEHPQYKRNHWVSAVQAGDTQRGYWGWVYLQTEVAMAEELAKINFSQE